MEAESYEGVDEQMLIDYDTTGAVEQKAVDAGEYKLTVVKAEGKSGTGKAGEWKGISVLLDARDNIEAKLINYMIFLPNPSGTPKQIEAAKSNFQKFKLAFGYLDTDTFFPSDLVGKEAWAYLTVKDDPEYGMQNRVSKWINSQG